MTAKIGIKKGFSMMALAGLMICQPVFAGELSDGVLKMVSDDGLKMISSFKKDSADAADDLVISSNAAISKSGDWGLAKEDQFSSFMARFEANKSGTGGKVKSLLVKRDGSVERLNISIPKMEEKASEVKLKEKDAVYGGLPGFIVNRKISGASLAEEFSLKNIDGKLVRVEDESVLTDALGMEHHVSHSRVGEGRTLVFWAEHRGSKVNQSTQIEIPSDIKGQIVGFSSDAEGKRFTVQMLNGSKISECVLEIKSVNPNTTGQPGAAKASVKIASFKKNIDALEDFVANVKDAIPGRSVALDNVRGLKVQQGSK